MRHGTHDDPVKPKGYKKPNSRFRVSRSPVYLPVTTVDKVELAMWNMANGRSRTDARVGP